MNKRKLIGLSAMSMLLVANTQAAVHINEGGTGEVLIYPYYTVNNNFNTVYTVVNTTADTKAIKVRFLEGDNGVEVLDFNVYLDAYDVWSGALTSTTSTIGGHVGEPSASHVYADNSCAPFLLTNQEFLPFVIDQDPLNNNMQRARDGHIEVIEQATFIGPTQAWADHETFGVPASCNSIAADWADNDIYDTGDEDTTTGGLLGSAAIIDVANGMSVGYDAIALGNFWTGGFGAHTSPGSLFPNLNSGDVDTQSLINGEVVNASWFTGAEAVTALLMQNTLSNEYLYDSISAGSSEWVVTFPTKLFLTNFGPVRPPFSSMWNGFESCDEFSVSIWDREQLTDISFGAGPSFCYKTNIVEIYPPGIPVGAASSIFLDENFIAIAAPNNPSATENGWAKLTFEGPNQSIEPFSGTGLVGLPAVGFQVQSLTNAEAQSGLLARYLSSQTHKGTVKPLPAADQNMESSK